MIAIFDTSSFLSLVKYYLPLDKSGEVKEIIKINYENSQIRVIDKVFKECCWVLDGFIKTKLEFLENKDFHIDTTEILPNSQFFNYVDNEFCNHAIIKEKEITYEQVQVAKKNYLNGADCKLMLYAQTLLSEDSFIVTEESAHGNDGKIHKKIPANCKHLLIKCCTLPEFLNERFDLTITTVVK